jgi:hypothetical protein
MAIVMAYFRPHTGGRGRAELAQDSGSFRAAALDELAGIGLAGVGGLAVGHRDQPEPGTGLGQLGQDSPRAEDLVIGVRREHYHTGRAAQATGRQLGQARPRCTGYGLATRCTRCTRCWCSCQWACGCQLAR